MTASIHSSTRVSDPYSERVSRREIRWVLWYGGLVMLITLLPYLLGYAVQGQDWRFTGFVFGVEDGNSYIAKMMGGSAGAWLFRTPYTAEPQRGVIAFLPYILLGKLAAPPGLHEQLVTLFHLFRLVAGMLEILITYHFLACFIQTVSLRRAALVLATLGGGLGWVIVLLGSNLGLQDLPLEFYSPETFGFLALFGLPHLALARAGLLYGLLAYLDSPHTPASPFWMPVVKIGFSWLVVALSQPLTAGIMGLLLSIAWLIFSAREWQVKRKNQTLELKMIARSAWTLVAAGIVPGLFLAYTLYLFQIDPYLKGWTEQNIISSPSPVYYLMAYGLVIPFAIIGGVRLSKRPVTQVWLLIIWIFLLPVLAYAPTNLQRRLPEGIWVAFSILSIGAFEGARSSRWRHPVKAGWAVAIASLPSTLFLILGGVMAANRPAAPVFQPASAVAAFEFLANQAKPGEVVLTSYETGNALPAWAPVRVVIGHGPESVGLAHLSVAVEDIFTSETLEADRRNLIASWGVDYVFRGPLENELGAWDPATSVSLTRIYQMDGTEIYHVAH